jgi:hypothetical protein
LCVFIIWLSYFAGWRLTGIDRENYIDMYFGVVNSDIFSVKLYHAKDIIFFILSEFVNLFTDDSRYLFTALILFSFSIKLFVFRNLSQRFYLLIFLIYLIFLSSVLEFIAFRSALSMSFLLLAIIKPQKKYLFLTLSVLSHVSSILPTLLLIPSFISYANKNPLVYFILFLMPIFIDSNVLSFLPQGDSYVDNQQGTWKALILPLLTLIISVLILYNFKNVYRFNPNNKIFIFINDSKTLIYSLIYFSIGITPFIVTAATRYLEFVYLLLLIAGVAMFKKSYFNFIGFLLLIFVLFYLNIVKNLWVNMFYPI